MKPFWQSKIFWLNILALLIEIGQYLAGTNIIPSGTLLVIVNVLNIILRFMTSKALTGDNVKE